MIRRALLAPVCALLGLSACFDPTKDTGAIDTAAVGGADAGSADGGGPSGADSSGDGSDGGARDVESCDWPEVGLCVEFANYDGAEGWCVDIGSGFGFETAYADGPCPGGAVGTCDIADSPGDDFPTDATLYFYPEYPADPEGACGEAGGSWG